ncbi:hypothetical protein [Streptomyces prunicolor]|uniref:Uncharacterized protein n=1 Tax=Streptomyces prunicolor TaxID=67348 RepID=A0ABU4FK58_9ACTN|nr:hypothetical protein [Streptomyces prunicolor]MDV7221013.1 hypothetical protein [Streptomyces prunicolor]
MPVSPTGWTAIFKPYREEPIVGWDDLGSPLIIDPTTGKRIGVHDLADHEFCNAERADPAFVGVIPADGWKLRWPDGSDDTIFAFAVQANGVMRPIVDSFLGYGSPFYPEEGARPPLFIRNVQP